MSLADSALPSADTIYAIERPSPKLLWLYALRAFALGLLGPWFWFSFLPFYFRYHTLRYRFDAEGVAMSWGVFWRREIYLTYARVQDIHLSRGLFERWFGLATIQLQTAAGSSGAEMSIEGLAEYETVRDFLYSRMRGASHREEPQPATEDSAELLLGEIRDELRALRQTLEAR
ncbi:MAG: PH domain-containing protein [Myxococcales bacterium]|nr:PH domain-containing protein [Myxococcales bacterium]